MSVNSNSDNLDSSASYEPSPIPVIGSSSPEIKPVIGRSASAEEPSSSPTAKETSQKVQSFTQDLADILLNDIFADITREMPTLQTIEQQLTKLKNEFDLLDNYINKLSENPENAARVTQAKNLKTSLEKQIQDKEKMIGLIREQISTMRLLQNPWGIDVLTLPKEAFDLLKIQLANPDNNNVAKHSTNPLMRMAAIVLRENYNLLGADTSNVVSILLRQHENIIQLAKLFDSISNDPGMIVRVLNELSDEEFQNIIQPFFIENKPLELTDEQIEEFKAKIEVSVARLIQKTPKTDLEQKAIIEQFRMRRDSDPTDSAVIREQGKVYKGERLAKPVARKRVFSNLNISRNVVTSLEDAQKQEAFAYFKSGDKGKASMITEKFAWDMAGIFKRGAFFVGTKKSTLQFMKDSTGVPQPAKEEFVDHSGSFQRARGETLDKFLAANKGFQFDQTQVIQASLIHQLFGMFDAHSSNILVDKKTHLLFFDNTCCFPHSNGIILWGDRLRLCFRCGLFKLSETYKTLTLDDKKFIKDEIEKFKIRLSAMEDFLANPEKAEELGQLPTGWFNTPEVIASLKERLTRMEAAINNPKVQNLRDFHFAVQPEAKFIAILELFINSGKAKDLDTLQKKVFPNVGYATIDKVFENLYGFPFSLANIRDYCKDPTLSLEQIIVKINDDIKFYSKLPKSEQDRLNRENIEMTDRFIQEFKQTAKIDYKDIDQEKIPGYLFTSALIDLKDQGFTTLKFHDPYDVSDFADQNPDMRVFIVADTDVNPPHLTLVHDLNGNYEFQNLNYSSQPGKLIGKLNQNAFSLTAGELSEEFLEEIENSKFSPSFALESTLKELSKHGAFIFEIDTSEDDEGEMLIDLFKNNNELNFLVLKDSGHAPPTVSLVLFNEDTNAIDFYVVDYTSQPQKLIFNIDGHDQIASPEKLKKLFKKEIESSKLSPDFIENLVDLALNALKDEGFITFEANNQADPKALRRFARNPKVKNFIFKDTQYDPPKLYLCNMNHTTKQLQARLIDITTRIGKLGIDGQFFAPDELSSKFPDVLMNLAEEALKDQRFLIFDSVDHADPNALRTMYPNLSKFIFKDTQHDPPKLYLYTLNRKANKFVAREIDISQRGKLGIENQFFTPEEFKDRF